MQLKSPGAQISPSLYGETLNASLRVSSAALSKHTEIGMNECRHTNTDGYGFTCEFTTIGDLSINTLLTASTNLVV